MERNGLEKIKTIGDAYLAVCGLPNEDEQHAVKTVNAALEILNFISKRLEAGGRFEIRIGIHSGSLVAGIVGVKKFAYDIWGDTVNTASRMQSSGDPGKINISESTFELVHDQFVCHSRGKIEAKNKGMIEMYFVDHTRIL
jgi:class 3 adenylate cyclase